MTFQLFMSIVSYVLCPIFVFHYVQKRIKARRVNRIAEEDEGKGIGTTRYQLTLEIKKNYRE